MSYSDYSNNPGGFNVVIMQSVVDSIPDISLENIVNFIVTSGSSSASMNAARRQLRGADAVVKSEVERETELAQQQDIGRAAPGAQRPVETVSQEEQQEQAAVHVDPTPAAYAADLTPAAHLDPTPGNANLDVIITLPVATAADRRRSAGSSSNVSPADTLVELHPLASSSLSVSYSIVLTTAALTYADLQYQLTQSVETGQFNSFLHTNADTYNVPALTTASSTITSTQNSGDGTDDSTGSGSGGSSSTMTLPMLVGIAVGAGALLGIVVTAFYFCFCRPATSKNNCIIYCAAFSRSVFLLCDLFLSYSFSLVLLTFCTAQLHCHWYHWRPLSLPPPPIPPWRRTFTCTSTVAGCPVAVEDDQWSKRWCPLPPWIPRT